MVLLGLARVAEDERGPQGGLGSGGADGVDALEEPGRVTPTPHALDQWTRHVLQRQVEVGHAGRHDGLDERVVEGRGVEIQEPDALDPLRQVADEPDDGALGPGARRHTIGRVAVEPPRGQVLGHEHHLVDTGAELVHLGHDEVVGRDRCTPRNDGMAQNPQRRSHPSATFT